MPGGRSVGSSARFTVSGAEPVSAETYSHGALVVRCAVHARGWSPPEVESINAAARDTPLPAGAESTTLDGVTSITLLGRASKSFPTLQPMSATATSEASVPGFVRIECPLRVRTFHAWLPHGDLPHDVGFGRVRGAGSAQHRRVTVALVRRAWEKRRGAACCAPTSFFCAPT